MGSKILPLDHPAWETHKALPMIVGVNDILEDEEFEDTVEVTAYKTRDEYKEEKRGV